MGQGKSDFVARSAVVLACRNGHRRYQRIGRQGFVLQQILAQCRAAHGEHDIVGGGIKGGGDGLDARGGVGLRREAARAGDALIEHTHRGLQAADAIRIAIAVIAPRFGQTPEDRRHIGHALAGQGAQCVHAAQRRRGHRQRALAAALGVGLPRCGDGERAFRIGVHGLHQQADAGDPIDQGVVNLGIERDAPVFQPLDQIHPP